MPLSLVRGHNGLVAAFYLAQAGKRVLMVEARDIIGGCCVTEELIPGFRFSTCANVIWALRPMIVQDMRLYERGLVVDKKTSMRLLPDGRFLYSGRASTNAAPGEDMAALQSEIAKFSSADAEAYPRWQAFWFRISRILGPYLLQPPPRLHQIYASCSDPDDQRALDTILTTSFANLADSFFESDLMRNLEVPADIGSVNDVGTGLLQSMFLTLGTYSETGEAVPNGYVRGGMGQITTIMAQAVKELGVRIVTGSAVTQILVEEGQARGVELASGEQIEASCVISNADPKRTFLKLLDPRHLDTRFLNRVRRLQTEVGTCLKLHCALSEFPQYHVAEGLTEEQLQGTTVTIEPNREYRQAAWYSAEQGQLPEAPTVRAYVPSIYDPSLAPAGRYTWSAYFYWVPVRLRQGTWAERKEEMAERLFKIMDRYAPNFRRALLDYVLFTPADLEQRMYLTDGNIHHVDGTPTQLLCQRPLEELAHYRTPIQRLYLCGAGMHPWGEVTGAPGYNAAHVILADDEGKKGTDATNPPNQI